MMEATGVGVQLAVCDTMDTLTLPDAGNFSDLQPADTENTYLVPSVAASIVQDLTAFTDTELADKLPVIGINFSCKACGAVKDSLKELMQHLSSDQCQQSATGGSVTKRRRGRPKRAPQPGASDEIGGEDKDGIAVKRPRGRPRKVPGAQPPKPEPRKAFQVPQVFHCPRPHATRISTGAIKRRNITQILGIKTEDDDLDDYQPTVISPQDGQVAEDSGGITTVVGSTDGGARTVDSIVIDSPAVTADTGASKQGTTEWGYSETLSENMEKPQVGTDLQTATATEIFKKSLTHLPKGTKVSLIPQTLLDIKSAAARGQQTRPVVTIKAEDGQGSIVIPASVKDGETKHMVIPNTLLLEALNNHKKSDDDTEQTEWAADSQKQDQKVKSDHEQIHVEHNDSQGESSVQQDITQVLTEVTPSMEPGQSDTEHQEEASQCDTSRDNDNTNSEDLREEPAKSVFQRLLFNPSGRPRPYRCPYCIIRYFATRQELDLHMDTHVHKSKGSGSTLQSMCKLRDNYACREPDCNFTVNKWSRMLTHLMKHPSTREKLKNARCVKNIYGSFICPTCKKEFDQKANMIAHHETVHKKRARTCEICAASLKVDLATFNRHVEKCRNVIIQCDKCTYKTLISANMRNHQKLHSSKALKCAHCEKAFSTKQRLQVHLESHRKDRPRFSCPHCESKFLTKDALNKHVARTHERHEIPFACTKCLYVAKIETDLTKHDKLVHNKRFKCEQEDCDFMSNSEQLYKIHQDYHRPECVHACPMPKCYFRCPSEALLSDHCVKVHNSESKHKCPICYKMFKRKTHLLRHLVTHTDDKPYSCGECKMTFYSHSTYYRHRRKTGHDSGREGVTSVPQHIVITYVQEGKDEVTLDYNIRTKRYGPQQTPQAVQDQPNPTDPDPDLGQAVESIAPSQTEVPEVPLAGQDEVVLVETSEAQFLQEIHMAELAPEPLTGTTMEVCEEVDPSPMAMLNHVVLPGQVATDGLTEGSQCLENIVSLPEGPGQQYTYILSTPDADSVLTDGHLQMAPPPVSGPLGPGEELVEAGALRPDLLGPGAVGDLAQSVVYSEGAVTGTETVVKVTPPGGGQQYAILLVPSARDEPEAALSMLQLQSSL